MSIKETVESFIKFRRSIGRKDQSTTYSFKTYLFPFFCLKLQSIIPLTYIRMTN